MFFVPKVYLMYLRYSLGAKKDALNNFLKLVVYRKQGACIMSATQSTYNVEKIKSMYEGNNPEDVPELIPAIVIALIQDNFTFLENFNPFAVLQLMPIVARWMAGERDCACGEPDCQAHEIFMALVDSKFETWQPVAA